MKPSKASNNTGSGRGQSCCQPTRTGPAPKPAPPIAQAPTPPTVADAVDIPGGTAMIGTDQPEITLDAESPLRQKRVKPFRLGQTVVTNQQFAAFQAATHHVTDAERLGWSYVFWSHVDTEIQLSEGVVGHEWWRRIDGANWRDINGPGSEQTAWHPDHPVVHVSWNDATAYARWVGGRLPNEVEWEHAARGGLGDVRFPWGDDEPDDDGFQPCNIWQGPFPHRNLALDGYQQTAPARSFAPNGFGLYNMSGNVWEWTRDPFVIRSASKAGRQRQSQIKGFKLLKGGSFLCHRSYCYRYRIAARTSNSPDTSLSHTGFRVAWSA